MRLKVFPDSNVYISDHDIHPIIDEHGYDILPIDARYMDIKSIKIDAVHASTYSLHKVRYAYVYTNGSKIPTYEGQLVSYTDDTVTILGTTEMVIRGYDTVRIDERVIYMGQPLGKVVRVSYLTTGIDVTMQHLLYMEGTYGLDCIVTNNTNIAYDDANIEVMVSNMVQNSPSPRMTYGVAYAEQDIGTTGMSVFHIDGTHNLPAGYETTIPLTSTKVDIHRYYTIPMTTGTSRATLVCEFISPIDMPSGKVYIYNSNTLESVSYIGMYSIRETVTITTNTIPGVYTISNLTRKSEKHIEHIRTIGKIHNTLPIPTVVRIVYYVGTTPIHPIEGEFIRDGDNIYVQSTLPPKSTLPYTYAFDTDTSQPSHHT